MILATLPSKEERVVEGFKAAFGDVIRAATFKPKRIKVLVEKEKWVELARYVKDHLGFDHITSIAGVDYPKENEFEVLYHVATYTVDEMKNTVLALATRIPRDDPKLPSLVSVWRSAEFGERETYEMFGIIFEGHPNLKRLLLPEDWADIPPLRKEFVSPRTPK